MTTTRRSSLSLRMNKTHKNEDKKRLEDFKKAAEGPRRVTATESTSEDMHITSAIGGKITISFLRKGMAGHYETTLKEIEECSIQSDQDVGGMKWKDVRNLIQTDKWKRLKDANPEGTKDLLPEQVKEFVPVLRNFAGVVWSGSVGCLGV